EGTAAATGTRRTATGSRRCRSARLPVRPSPRWNRASAARSTGTSSLLHLRRPQVRSPRHLGVMLGQLAVHDHPLRGGELWVTRGQRDQPCALRRGNAIERFAGHRVYCVVLLWFDYTAANSLFVRPGGGTFEPTVLRGARFICPGHGQHPVHEPLIGGFDDDRVAGFQLVQFVERCAASDAVPGDSEVALLPG